MNCQDILKERLKTTFVHAHPQNWWKLEDEEDEAEEEMQVLNRYTDKCMA
jgi:hypothetical protein